MTLHVSGDVADIINAAVQSGRYASADEMIARLVEEDARRSRPPLATEPNAPEKPIWEEILESTADVPGEEWDKLPTDLAEQHDHYIYGTPKRPSS